jgi:hypothetical protein
LIPSKDELLENLGTEIEVLTTYNMSRYDEELSPDINRRQNRPPKNAIIPKKRKNYVRGAGFTNVFSQ